MSTSAPVEQAVEIPGNVEVSLKKRMLHVSGKLGRTHKSFSKIPVELRIEGGSVLLRATGTRKKDRAILNTARSIVRNLVEGVENGYTVRLKVVYAHFPITVKTKDGLVLVENFQGERAARTARILGQTKVDPKGEDVVITGPVLTDVTQTAANIQQATRIKKKDHRVFLDGIYVYEKKAGIE